MDASKDILEKLHGKWLTIFSNGNQNVDVELTINKKGKGSVKYLSGTNTKAD